MRLEKTTEIVLALGRVSIMKYHHVEELGDYYTCLLSRSELRQV